MKQLDVTVKGVISDGEETIRSAVAFVFPGVPHQLCLFHYSKDATKLLYEADRHAKTQLKKHLRGVRPIERALEEYSTPENDATRGYSIAVRAALTDDGRSPLQPSGLKLYDRITQVSDSIAHVQEKKRLPPALKLLQQLLTKGVKATVTLWPPLQSAYEQAHQAALILANQEQLTWMQVRERYLAHVCQMQEQKASLEPLGEAIEHFCHITDNFEVGLFHCYDVEGLPRTNAIVTRKQSFSAEELQPSDYQRWRDLGTHLQQYEETRRQQFRFRKNPAAYLTAFEAQLLT